MSLTILIDLDDTLLTNDMDAFLPPYLQALAKHLSHRFDGNKLIRCLLDATRQMVENTRPDRTLEEVFAAHFYPALNATEEELRPEIESFYAEIYPALKPLTIPRPAAVKFVDEAFRRGHRVVVATNPLFPKAAVYQRLSWAGLPISDYPFEIVTSYETFHFTKPHRAYYAEVMAQLGWPPGAAVMVGNDQENDTAPARQVGLFTYLLTDERLPGSGSRHSSYSGGTFENLPAWLDWLEAAQPEPDIQPRAALLPILSSTPAALSTLTADLTPDQWKIPPAPGEWSIAEIMCHLRDVGAEVDLPRIQKILVEHNPFLTGMDTDPWAAERRYSAQNGPQALADFTATRIRLLDILEKLPAAGWSKPARHAIFGPTRIDELIGFITTHDRVHVQQAYQTICSAAVQHPAAM